ncbi:MAG: SEC-C metal-binding domain-containing protein [Oliverpabstia sp.]|nr:SEC-C metal-binding domain-containing protein [Oliverpabstia sp.]
MGQCSAFTTFCSGLSRQLINEAKLISNGKEFYTSKAQWDTGATGTCISGKVIQDLGLLHHGFVNIHTPSGEKTVKKYFVDIVLRNDVTIKNVEVMESEIGNQDIDILIGMDIISLGDFSVSNFNGKTQFSFRIPSQAHTDYVQVLKNQIPVTKDKTYPNDPCPCGSGKKYKKCCGKNK